jgi:arylsulfatase A-like enzyme
VRRAPALLALALLFQPFSVHAEAARRPNVVLIITDDQGYGDLGLHGNDRIKTPNLDRLGRESVRLTRFYVSPVCAPTRASLLTGRYNYRTGVVDTYLGRAMMHPDETTLAEQLAQSGYRTGIFGKWHLGDNYPLRPIDQGFQESLVCTGGGITQPSDPEGNHYQDPQLLHNGRTAKFRGYCTDIFTDHALKFVERNRARPFFLYLAPNAPHTPLEIDESKVVPYRAAGLDETTARIYAMATNIDENVGRLLHKLRDAGLERDTIVLFLTDNGPQQPRYNAGMRGLKGGVYEGGIRVPCFVRWPAALKPAEVDTPAAHIDLAPTLLDACGLSTKSEAKIDGRSVLPLLRGDGPEWPDRPLFLQWHRGDQPEPFRNAAVITRRYKLVDGKELYDLQADPAERKDQAAEHPEVVSRLRREYVTWFQDVSSTRGYDPPRIGLGSGRENPVRLTRQDWRGPRAGWDPSSLGYWEVEVEQKADYEVVLTIWPASEDSRAHLRLGAVALTSPLSAGQTRIRFGRVPWQKGPGRLEAWVEGSGKTVGVKYVQVRRLPPPVHAQPLGAHSGGPIDPVR